MRRLNRLARAALPVYPEEGIALLDAALAIADDTGDRGMALWLPLQRAMVAQRLGNHAEVRTALAQTSARVRADDPVQLRVVVDATSAMLLAGELLASPDTPIDETIVDALVNTQDQLRRTHPQIAAMVQMRLGAVRRRAGQLALSRAAYRQAETDARAANDLDQAAEAALKALEVEIEAGQPSDAALDELRTIAGAARTAGHVSREATARLTLGRGLLARVAGDAAVVELTRAQECFAACADDDGEAAATHWLDAARLGAATRPEDQDETPHR